MNRINVICLKQNSLMAIFVFVFLSWIWGCKSNNENFSGTRINTPYVTIEIDTITLNTREQCVSGIIYQEMYYIYSLFYGYNLCVFDKFGNIQNSSPLPEKINRYWMLDYSIKNDSLLVLNENHGVTAYFLDKKSGNFVLIDNMEAPVYEDKKYRILKTSNGEWGGMVYFIDKNTQEIYRAFSNEVINVIKFDNKYYVTNYLGHLVGHSSIYEITDPAKMQKFYGSINDIVNNHAESSEKECYVFEGLRNVIDTLDIHIAGSFIHKNRMLQLWNDYISHKVHITEIVNGKLVNRYTFDFGMDVKYLYFDGNKYFLNFDTDLSRNIYGIAFILLPRIPIIMNRIRPSRNQSCCFAVNTSISASNSSYPVLCSVETGIILLSEDKFKTPRIALTRFCTSLLEILSAFVAITIPSSP